MIAAALLLLQATAGQPMLDAIGRQELPQQGCAAYLWSLDPPQRLLAMAEPGRLRVRLDGRTIDLPRTGSEGTAGLGLAATTHYAAGDVAATVTLTVTERPDIVRGGFVSDASLTLQPRGRDMVVTPLAGMAGCR